MVIILRSLATITLFLAVVAGVIYVLMERADRIPERAIYTEGTMLQPMRNRISDYYILEFKVGKEVVPVVSDYIVYGSEKYHANDTIPILYYFSRSGKPMCYIHDCEVVGLKQTIHDLSHIAFSISLVLFVIGGIFAFLAL